MKACMSGNTCVSGKCIADSSLCNDSSNCDSGFGCENGVCVSRSEMNTDGQIDCSSVAVVNFNFDDVKILDEFSNVLDQIARCALEHPSYKINIEGHADERGTLEYNLSLGQRRAQQVADYLKQFNVTNNNNLVSFGSEKPAVAESNALAWKQNRRAEIKLAP